jgi:transcriptional regulator with XRE-family HTH domain
MQAFSLPTPYYRRMPEEISILRSLRLKAGLSMRQLAEMIGVDHSNLRYWENSGKNPRSDLLPAIAEALGVSTDELLGLKPLARSTPAGRAKRTFDRLAKLPRSQQTKILDVVEALVAQNKAS